MYMNLKSNKHKISFNATTMISLRFITVGTPTPLLKGVGVGGGGWGGGRTFQKLSHLGGMKFFATKGG